MTIRDQRSEGQCTLRKPARLARREVGETKESI